MSPSAVDGLVGLIFLGWLYWAVIWLGMVIGAAIVADAKGYSGMGFAFLTLVLPPVGIFMVIGLPSRRVEDMAEALREIRSTTLDLRARLPKP